MSNPKIYIASDHRGFALKAEFVQWLQEHGHEVQDLGPGDETSCGAGTYAVKLADEMKRNPAARGILICGSGQAMAMTANRYAHLRAALCCNATMARLSREHNDANVLALGAHITGREVAFDCLKTFLQTEFLGGRFTARLDQLNNLGGL